MEQGKEQYINITRKSAHLLKSYYTNMCSERNRVRTMIEIRHQHISLLQHLHQTQAARPSQVDILPRIAAGSICAATDNRREPQGLLSLALKKRRKRNPQTCRTCGHLRFFGKWRSDTYHNRLAKVGDPGFCTVPVACWVPPHTREKGHCSCED